MVTIPGASSQAKPTAVWPYFDKIAVWLKQPTDAATLTKLRMQCGHLHSTNRSARFDKSLRQRLEFKQPETPVLLWLASRSDAYINQAEIALDLVFDSERERDQAYQFFSWSLVRRWHGKRQQVRVNSGSGDTRYDAGRNVANSTVIYKEGFCRITGELNCLHIEWRALNGQAVRSAGLHTATELLNFDFHQFWQQRLLLFEVERERIGRYLRNQASKRRSQKPQPQDGRTGSTLIRSVDSVQELIDRYGSEFRIRRVLVRVSNENWLPEKRTEATTGTKPMKVMRKVRVGTEGTYRAR